jgi:hypothetical protein
MENEPKTSLAVYLNKWFFYFFFTDEAWFHKTEYVKINIIKHLR